MNRNSNLSGNRRRLLRYIAWARSDDVGDACPAVSAVKVWFGEQATARIDEITLLRDHLIKV
jgi:hypothetical protein